MHPADFTRLRPFAYHLTARANLPAIQSAARLDPAAALFRQANRPDLLRTRRPDMTPIAVGGHQVIIRDQDPLKVGHCALAAGFSFEDLVELLNQFVYFWPGTAQGPIPSGINHFKRYAKSEDAVVLRIPTADLFAANPTLIPHASAYNSGSPRCVNGRKSPRGPDTFQPFPDFPHPTGRVVELVFNTPIRLPWEIIKQSITRDWV